MCVCVCVCARHACVFAESVMVLCVVGCPTGQEGLLFGGSQFQLTAVAKLSSDKTVCSHF